MNNSTRNLRQGAFCRIRRCMAVALGLAVVLSAAWVGWAAEDDENLPASAFSVFGHVYYGDRDFFHCPCVLNIKEIFEKVPLSKQMTEEAFIDIIGELAGEYSFDLVVEWGGVSSTTGATIPDITDEVIALLGPISSTERLAYLRVGPGPYYRVLKELQPGTCLKRGESNDQWTQVEGESGKGWLSNLAFQKPQEGLDYSGLIKGSGVKVVSSTDISASAKGGLVLAFSQKHEMDDAHLDAARRLAALELDPRIVLSMAEALSKNRATAFLQKLPQHSFENSIILLGDAESLIGKCFAAYLLAVGLVEDEELIQYVNAVAAIVGEHTERYNITYKVAILNDDNPNGFGLPGGYILLTRGLLENMKNEAELACVLGHEMAHISLYHGLREFQNREIYRKRDALENELERELEREFGKSEDPLESDLEMLMDEAFLKIMAPRAREDELEADLHGVVYAACAGYDPRAMVELLSRINDQYDMEDTFKHHPTCENRIKQLTAAIDHLGLTWKSQKRLEDRFKKRVLNKIKEK